MGHIEEEHFDENPTPRGLSSSVGPGGGVPLDGRSTLPAEAPRADTAMQMVAELKSKLMAKKAEFAQGSAKKEKKTKNRS